jgi:hypothetical protein
LFSLKDSFTRSRIIAFEAQLVSYVGTKQQTMQIGLACQAGYDGQTVIVTLVGGAGGGA